eukprot:gene22686-30062_t
MLRRSPPNSPARRAPSDAGTPSGTTINNNTMRRVTVRRPEGARWGMV